jgi:tRNA dimethylallyltransferase
MDGIGYRPLVLAARGRMTGDEALRLMIRDTTRYAKRQMTWFARDPEIRWLDVDEAGGIDGAAETVLKQITQEGLTG